MQRGFFMGKSDLKKKKQQQKLMQSVFLGKLAPFPHTS